ncbi:integral membrane protein [Weissella viridescens]|uniref:Integral membrane protein n=2 Tax=Weissella viridescens TaxID=1629 RepID=A0A0R2GZW7_WEIVI|nr:integral membrane protein [Weissella viridescens]
MLYFDRHEYAARIVAAIIYALTSAIAINIFWTPGHIYSSGFTGLAQILNTLGLRYLHMNISIGLLLILLNVPVLILGYRKLGYRFTMFTALALLLAAIAIRIVPSPGTWVHDPLVLAIFGGGINGFGTGFALRTGLSTGGLDIIGIVARKKFGMRMGAVNLTFNFFILLTAGYLFGPQYALYTGISLIVNAYMIDNFYTRQQKLQVMIVTEQPDRVIEMLQQNIRRGITIVHDAEGGYNHHEKEILFTVISAYERYDFRDALEQADPKAWSSTWRIEHTTGRFYEPKL